MIPFEIDQVRVEHVLLKSLTTALGGSISVVDEARTQDGKEIYTKVTVPLAVVRAFIKEYEVRNYMKPVLTAVTFYGDHAVALERHPLGSIGEETTQGLFGERHWVSKSEANLDNVLMPFTLQGDWFTDGTHVFRVGQHDKDNAVFLSSDGRFRAVEVRSMKFAKMSKLDEDNLEDRTCLQFCAKNGQSVMTSPIWKRLDTIGGRQMDRAGADDEEDVGIAVQNHQFDRVDQWLSVNLGFTLKAGREVSRLFGFEAIEPLNLDKLMVQLQTVNLPSIPKSVKQTFDVGIPFTHAVAWLIGLTARTETLDSYIVLRSLLKYLTTKGIYRKGAFTPESVYRNGQTADNVELMNIEQAAGAEVNLDIHDIHLMRAMKEERALGVGAAGGLYDAD